MHAWQFNIIWMKLENGPQHGGSESAAKRANEFSRKTSLQFSEIRLRHNVIQYVPRYRYLSVILDHRLNWSGHWKATISGYGLIPLKVGIIGELLWMRYWTSFCTSHCVIYTKVKMHLVYSIYSVLWSNEYRIMCLLRNLLLLRISGPVAALNRRVP